MPCMDYADDNRNYYLNDYRNAQAKVNKLTALLCKATFLLKQSGTIDENNHTDLYQWSEEHLNQDVHRLKKEINDILKRKDVNLKRILNWYSGLEPQEQFLIHSHPEFVNLKLDGKEGN